MITQTHLLLWNSLAFEVRMKSSRRNIFPQIYINIRGIFRNNVHIILVGEKIAEITEHNAVLYRFSFHIRYFLCIYTICKCKYGIISLYISIYFKSRVVEAILG